MTGLIDKGKLLRELCECCKHDNGGCNGNMDCYFCDVIAEQPVIYDGNAYDLISRKLLLEQLDKIDLEKKEDVFRAINEAYSIGEFINIK